MNKTLFLASGLYADLKSMGFSNEEIADTLAWAVQHQDEIDNAQDYVIDNIQQ